MQSWSWKPIDGMLIPMRVSVLLFKSSVRQLRYVFTRRGGGWLRQHMRECGLGSFCCWGLMRSALGLSPNANAYSVANSYNDYFHEPALPGVQFGTIFCCSEARVCPSRLQRRGHFTCDWVAVVQRGMTVTQLAQAVNETPVVITDNYVQIAGIEARGGFDPSIFCF